MLFLCGESNLDDGYHYFLSLRCHLGERSPGSLVEIDRGVVLFLFNDLKEKQKQKRKKEKKKKRKETLVCLVKQAPGPRLDLCRFHTSIWVLLMLVVLPFRLPIRSRRVGTNAFYRCVLELARRRECVPSSFVTFDNNVLGHVTCITLKLLAVRATISNCGVCV